MTISVDGRAPRVIALPGVPAELKPMWAATVMPALIAMMPEQATILQRRVKCFGAGESAIEAMLPDLVRRGRDPLVGITAHEATITLRIAARGRHEGECRDKIADTEKVIRECLGELVFGFEDDEVEDAALASLAAAGLSLATSEVGTTGLVASLCAGAEARKAGVYRGSSVYPASAIQDNAADLATRCRSEFGADVGLGIGPKRVGAEGREVIDIAIATETRVSSFEHVVAGGPTLAPTRAAKAALDIVRRHAAFLARAVVS